jgi:hypothetical protein
VPHTPSAVGAIARRKARFDLRAQHLVTTRAGTRAPPQPRIKPAARDTEPLAENRHRPDPPVLRNEPCPVLREVGGGFLGCRVRPSASALRGAAARSLPARASSALAPEKACTVSAAKSLTQLRSMFG